MEKQCVFCGKRPESKTLEHVVPLWLIRLTGNQKRPIKLGPFFNEPHGREISFDALKFPACETCNASFAVLESRAKYVLESILTLGSLRESDLALLLDWLDKVRVGLWLGYRYLDKDYFGVSPHFTIGTRVAKKDRSVIITRSEEQHEGVHFIGANTPLFQHTPCCFSLLVNSVGLLNLSTDCLVSRRLGFPHPRSHVSHPSGELGLEMAAGDGRIRRPVIRRQTCVDGIAVHQPVFANALSSNAASLYDCEYVRANSLDWQAGLGRLFVESGQVVTRCPSTPSKNWVPPPAGNFRNWLRKMAISTVEFQNYCYDLYRPPKWTRSHQDDPFLTAKVARGFNENHVLQVLRANR